MLGPCFWCKKFLSIAAFTLIYHGEKLYKAGIISLEVWEAIKRAFYVDDLLKSCPDVETAKRVRIESTKACKLGGFDLIKWKSSHPEVLEDMGPMKDPVKVFSDKEDNLGISN